MEQLKSVKQEQIVDFYAQHMPQSAQKRRQISVHVVSNVHLTAEPQGAAQQDVTELDALKQDLSLCDLPSVPSLTS